MLCRQPWDEGDVACFEHSQRQTRHHALSIKSFVVFGSNFDDGAAIVDFCNDFVEFELGLMAVFLEDGFQKLKVASFGQIIIYSLFPICLIMHCRYLFEICSISQSLH